MRRERLERIAELLESASEQIRLLAQETDSTIKLDGQVVGKAIRDSLSKAPAGAAETEG